MYDLFANKWKRGRDGAFKKTQRGWLSKANEQKHQCAWKCRKEYRLWKVYLLVCLCLTRKIRKLFLFLFRLFCIVVSALYDVLSLQLVLCSNSYLISVMNPSFWNKFKLRLKGSSHSYLLKLPLKHNYLSCFTTILCDEQKEFSIARQNLFIKLN